MRPITPFELPNRAKIAMSVFVAFESFIKHSQYRRSGEKPDFASLAFGEFGARVGIWRIMDVLNKYDAKGTIDTNGLVAQKYPATVKELDAAGHEIVGHGWANDIYLDSLEPAKEKQIISDTLAALAAVTGKRPGVGSARVTGSRRTPSGCLWKRASFGMATCPSTRSPTTARLMGNAW